MAPALLHTDALGGETAALPEDALATSALAYERRAQPPAALAGAPPRPPPSLGTGWAYTTVAGGAPPKDQANSELRKKALKYIEKGLDGTKDVLKRYLTKEGRGEEALKKSVKESLAAMVEAGIKSAAIDALDKVPFVKVMRVTLELSLCFADGVGRAMQQVTAELDSEGDVYFYRVGDDGEDEETTKLIQVWGARSAEATKRLPRILAEGLGDVAVKAMQMVIEKLGEIALKTLGSILDDVASQLAEQLERRYDFIAVFREAVNAAGDNIPKGRREVERKAFNFVSGVFIDQLADKELQEKLKTIISLGKDFPVEGKLLTSLMKMLIDGSYKVYIEHVDVPYVQAELEQLLLEGARKVAGGLVGVTLEPSPTGDVEVAPDRIKIPQNWLLSLLETAETSTRRRDEYNARYATMKKYAGQLTEWLDVRKGEYRAQWLPYAGRSDKGRYDRLKSKWTTDWRQAIRLFDEAAENVVKDFGEAWGGFTIRTDLSLIKSKTLRDLGGSEKLAPPFAPYF